MSTPVQPVTTEAVDQLQVRVYQNRQALGAAAGYDVGVKMRELLNKQDHIRMVFAAAPSQNEFLQALIQEQGIEWLRVSVFHMDEYLGLAQHAPQRLGRFLSDRLFDIIKPGQVYLIDSTNAIEAECLRYSALLSAAPIDIVSLGIGENGHIAFNDPVVADFNDPQLVKPVALDETSRLQQVHDGCFPNVEAVPSHALTLTLPALMWGKSLFCIVPAQTKRNAVHQALRGPISPACPASIIRRHPNCVLYLDTDSFDHASPGLATS
jgi:glucosamine-6-phosphate deaminase